MFPGQMTALLLALLPADSQAAERLWADCRTCHAVVSPDGTVLARGGRSGPNLFGLEGRRIAADGDFRFYSDAMRAAGATGTVWTEERFVAYLAGPDQFLRSLTGDANARADMHVEMRQGARDLFRFLQDLSQ